MDRVKINNFLKVIVKGGAIIFIGSIIGKAFRFILFVCLIRVLGASMYGLYSLGQGIVDIITNLGLLGDGRGLIRFAAGFHQEKDNLRLKGIIQSYIFICLIVSVIIAILLFLWSSYISIKIFHNSDLINVLKIFAVSFPFYVFALLVIPIGFAFQQMKYKLIIQEVSQPVVNIVIVSVIFILGGRLLGAVYGFLLSSVATAILGFYLLRDLFPELVSKSKSILEMKKLVMYSLPLIGVVFCYYLLFRLDRIILGAYRTPFEVGVYSAASNTAIGILAFSGIFETAFVPVIAQLCQNNNWQELKRIYNCLASWGVCLAFIPCITLIIFNQEIVQIFGKDLSAASPVLVILSVSFLIEALPGQAKQLLQMSSRQNIEFINSFVMIFINILLNLVFIPSFGVIGAALAFLLTIVVISLLRVIELKMIFGFLPFDFRYWKLLGYIFIAVIASFLIIFNCGIFLKSLVSAFIFVFFAYLVYKLKTQEDLLIWDSIRSKLTNYRFVNN